MLHTALETGNLAGLNSEQQGCVTKVRSAIHHAVRRLGGKPEIFREHWTHIQDFSRGIIDLLAVSGKKALVADAKFGRREVADAEVNMQGICYVVGVFEAFSDVDEIEVLFAQPRCDMLSSATFARSQYASLLLQLKSVRARVWAFAESQDTAMLRPQEDNCAWCGNLGVCPAITHKALAIGHAYDLAHDNELPDLFHPGQLATPELRAKAEQLRKIMTAWCASVQKHNLQYRLDGNEIPGYELRHRKGDRTITLPKAAFEVAQRLTGHSLTLEDLAKCCTISATKLDDMVAEKFPRGKKAKAKLELEDALIDADALKLAGETSYLGKIKISKEKQLFSRQLQ
ncbi:MAG: DUF2800 domain-containing protein [Luteolibacter sp.]